MAFRASSSRSLFAAARSSLRPPAPLLHQRSRSLTVPRLGRDLYFATPRQRAALGCLQSLLPLHSVVAAARLASYPSASARASRWIDDS